MSSPDPTSLRTHPLLAQAENKVPALAGFLDRHGTSSLAEYGAGLRDHECRAPQPCTDVAEAAGEVATSVLGPEAGAAVCRSLEQRPVVVTGPHHGLDTMPVTVQGTLAFCLADSECVCVMGSSNVPLSNYTTPGGLALARSRAGQKVCSHTRVHFFPASERAMLVRACGPIGDAQVEHARRRVQALHQEGTLELREKRGLDRLLGDVFGDREVLGQPSLSHQATAIAPRMWQRMLPDEKRPVFHIDKDEVVRRLLLQDLGNPESLAYRVFFSKPLRDRVMVLLDGAYGCWSARRLEALSSEDGHTEPPDGPVGTTFFWALDARGARVPMRLESGSLLCGCGCSGGEHSVPFTPDGLRRALAENRLVPGLFTTFLAMCFARGVRCVGGQLQAGYLPVMRQALADALREAGGPAEQADADLVERMGVREVVTGLMGVMRGDVADGRMVGRMAGALEIILAGGLDRNALDRLSSLTVLQATFAGLLEMYPVLFSEHERVCGWETELRRELQGFAESLVLLPG